MFKLGTKVRDGVTKQRGMLTHLYTQMDGSRMYLFQPRELNSETGVPVEDFFITENRVQWGEEVEDPYLAMDVLGTEVEDDGSGFKGTAIASILHINGCLHVDVQPSTIQKNGSRVKMQNFDIRRLIGKAIKPMKQPELERSIQASPSPAPCPSFRPGV